MGGLGPPAPQFRTPCLFVKPQNMWNTNWQYISGQIPEASQKGYKFQPTNMDGKIQNICNVTANTLELHTMHMYTHKLFHHEGMHPDNDQQV